MCFTALQHVVPQKKEHQGQINNRKCSRVEPQTVLNRIYWIRGTNPIDCTAAMPQFSDLTPIIFK